MKAVKATLGALMHVVLCMSLSCTCGEGQLPSTERDDNLRVEIMIVSSENRVMVEYWVKNISPEPLIIIDRYPREKKDPSGGEGHVVVESGLLDNWFYVEMGEDGTAYIKRMTEDSDFSNHHWDYDDVAYGRRIQPGETLGDTMSIDLPLKEKGNWATREKKQIEGGYRDYSVTAVQFWLGWMTTDSAKKQFGYDRPEKYGSDEIYPFFAPRNDLQNICKSNWVRVDWEGLRYE